MSIDTCPKCAYKRKPAESVPDHTCPSCGIVYVKYDAAAEFRNRLFKARSSGDWSGIPRDQVPREFSGHFIANMPVTTAADIPGRQIEQVVDVVSAECAYGMDLFKDFFASVTDVLGGRSGSTQVVLRDARKKVMAELRAEAWAVGGDAVIGVDLDYSEFSGGGKSMLFVVATGTAVKLAVRS